MGRGGRRGGLGAGDGQVAVLPEVLHGHGGVVDPGAAGAGGLQGVQGDGARQVASGQAQPGGADGLGEAGGGHVQWAAGPPPRSAEPGALSAERRQKLDDIDPAWCPAWPIAWQRCFHLARTHLAGDGFLPEEDGLLIVQGEDIGRWIRTQRAEWDTLTPPQQWLLSEICGLQPLERLGPEAVPEPAPRRSRAEMWADNLTAARQYAQREGHLNVPRSHIENIGGTEHALGVFIANSRARKSNLASERVEELTAIGMGWA